MAAVWQMGEQARRRLRSRFAMRRIHYRQVQLHRSWHELSLQEVGEELAAIGRELVDVASVLLPESSSVHDRGSHRRPVRLCGFRPDLLADTWEPLVQAATRLADALEELTRGLPGQGSNGRRHPRTGALRRPSITGPRKGASDDGSHAGPGW